MKNGGGGQGFAHRGIVGVCKRLPSRYCWTKAGMTTFGFMMVLLYGVYVCNALGMLPQRRAFEMVSPSYKAGNAALGPTAVAPDGDSVWFGSLGVFADEPLGGTGGLNPYIARRGANGWTTSPLSPPAALAPRGNIEDVSANMSESLAYLHFGKNLAHSEEATTAALYLRDPEESDTSGAFAQASPLLKTVGGEPLGDLFYIGASSDFSHFLLELANANPETVLLPTDTTDESSTDFYEVARGGNVTPVLRLLGIDNKEEVIDPHCNMQLGSEISAFNAISANSSRVFFTDGTNPNGQLFECGEKGDPTELFVRVNGHETIEISKPSSEACIEVPCPEATTREPAVFQGASEDGSRVFFTATQSLIKGADKDEENDLYMAEIGEQSGKAAVTSLVMVSEGDPGADLHPGEGADVKGVVRISEDGSRVYFVALGVLAGANAEGQSPVEGADNLYVYDAASKETTFISELCSRVNEKSGSASDSHCKGTGPGNNDEKLWKEDIRHAQSVPQNGQFLVFSSSAELTPDDTDTTKDIYRYDAETGQLLRVSIGEEGFDNNGNNNTSGVEVAAPDLTSSTVVDQREMNNRAVSENGATIVFSTVDPLSSKAINGLANVYEWHEGRVSLISSGTASEGDGRPVITPSGNDIFFVTSSKLVPQDTDELADVYDARIEGGFPQQSAVNATCSGDACQGPLSLSPGSLSVGSPTQTGGGNVIVAAAKRASKSKPKKRVTKKRRSRRRSRKAAKGITHIKRDSSSKSTGGRK
jgi:hypothetical protein